MVTRNGTTNPRFPANQENRGEVGVASKRTDTSRYSETRTAAPSTAARLEITDEAGGAVPSTQRPRRSRAQSPVRLSNLRVPVQERYLGCCRRLPGRCFRLRRPGRCRCPPRTAKTHREPSLRGAPLELLLS